MRAPRRGARVASAALAPLFALALVGCDDGPRSTFDQELLPGPFAAGTLSVSFVDDTRTTPAYGTYAGASTRTLATTITYPATVEDVDAPVAAGGPFPVVLYSHGFSSSQGENPRLAAHLASHGYVVVAPSFPLSNIGAPDGPTGIDIAEQPRDLTFLLDTVLDPIGTPAASLAGAVDGSRVVAAGLSLGAMTTLLVTFHPTLRDPRIDVAAAFAPPTTLFGPDFYTTVDTPLMVLHGNADAIVAYDPNATEILARKGPPFWLFELERGTHTGFLFLASLFDGAAGYEHVDKLGCDGIMVTGGGGGSFSAYDILGGAAAGLVANPTQGAFCPTPLGIGMSPNRQLDITDAATLAFLDAYLSPVATRRSLARDYFEHRLANEPDIVLHRP